MTGQHRAAVLQEEIRKIIKLAFCGNGRIESAQCSRSCITWIGKARKPGAIALLIHTLKRAELHDHFAANFKSVFFDYVFLDSQGKGANGSGIFRNIFTDAPVPARDSLLESAPIKLCRHREAIQLQLGYIFGTLAFEE